RLALSSRVLGAKPWELTCARRASSRTDADTTMTALRRPLIAIDATSVPPQPAGAGRYTLNLIHVLTKIDEDHDYGIYARTHTLPELSDLDPRVTVENIGPLS